MVERSGKRNGEPLRQATSCYAANQEVASADVSLDVEESREMLASGEHAPLDVGFPHTLLKCSPDGHERSEAFVRDLDRVAEYYAAEHAERCDSPEEVPDWLPVCGFLTVRESTANTYHVVFPTADVMWFVLRFLRASTTQLRLESEIERGVSRVLLRTVPA